MSAANRSRSVLSSAELNEPPLIQPQMILVASIGYFQSPGILTLPEQLSSTSQDSKIRMSISRRRFPEMEMTSVPKQNTLVIIHPFAHQFFN
jgi:hypothetical protein